VTVFPPRRPIIRHRVRGRPSRSLFASLAWLAVCCATGCAEPDAWTTDDCCGVTRTFDLSEPNERSAWHAGGDVDVLPAATRASAGLRLRSRKGRGFVSRSVSLPAGEIAQLEIALTASGTRADAQRGDVSSLVRASLGIDIGNRTGLVMRALGLALAGRFRESLSSVGYALRGLEVLPATATRVLPGDTNQQIKLAIDFAKTSWNRGPVREIRLGLASGADLTLDSVALIPLPTQGLHRVEQQWRPCQRALRARFSLSGGVAGRLSVELSASPLASGGELLLEAKFSGPNGRELHTLQRVIASERDWQHLELEPPPGSIMAGSQVAFGLRNPSTGLPVVGCFVAPRSPSTMATQQRPNVLLVSIDTLRADALSDAPFLSRLAKEGRNFPRTWSSSNWTLPSHASLFTATPFVRHATPLADSPLPHADASIPRSLPSFVQCLRDAGYVTAGTTEGGYLEPQFGFARGFDRYAVYLPERLGGSDPLPRHLRFARGLVAELAEQPFFLFAHSYEVHDYHTNTSDYHDFEPSDDEARYREMGSILPLIVSGEAPRRYAKQLYDAGVRLADRFVQDLVESVLEASHDAPLLVIVSSDHGEAFGEHEGVWNHGTSLLEEQVRIPFFVWGNFSQAPTGEVAAATSTIDVAPSLLRYLGLPIPASFAGESDRLLAKPALRRASPVTASNSQISSSRSGGRFDQALLDGRWKYLRSDAFDGSVVAERCFDLARDPGEQQSRSIGHASPCKEFPRAYGRLLADSGQGVVLTSNGRLEMQLESQGSDRERPLSAVRSAFGAHQPIADLVRGSLHWQPMTSGDALALVFRGGSQRLTRLSLDGVAADGSLDLSHIGTPEEPSVIRVPRKDGTTASVRAHAMAPLDPPPTRAVDPRLLEELQALGYSE
jgi:arylsulfatase A-like enzyme